MNALLERYVAALNGRRLHEMAEVVSKQVEHNDDMMSREAWWKDRVAANIAAVPDLRWNPQDVVVAGDLTCVRYTDTRPGTSIRWLRADGELDRVHRVLLLTGFRMDASSRPGV